MVTSHQSPVTSKKEIAEAKSYALRLIKFRPRSEKEVRFKLELKDFEPAVIDEAIAFLKSKRFLDDELFARLWIQSRVKRPFGFKRLRYELKQKGVASKLIENAIADAAQEVDEKEVVADIVERKIKSMSKLSAEKKKLRLYGLLIRRGFGHDLAMDELEKISK